MYHFDEEKMTPQKPEIPIVILVGPTAIGKTSLSLELAELFHCEIVSVDSMQVYRYMDIGTAKATIAERQLVPHHLIDVVDPDESYDAVRYARDASAAIHEIHRKGKIPLLTGGTGLYLRSLLHGIFPGVPESEEVRNKLLLRLHEEGSSKLHEELKKCDLASAEKIHHNDSQRILRALEVYYTTGKPLSVHIIEHKAISKDNQYPEALQIGLTTDRKKLYKRINARTEIMIESGLEEEVKQLLHMGYSEKLNSMNSIGYRHMINYLNEAWSREQMFELLARDTRRYAKRQYTWFSKNDDLAWFDVDDREKVIKQVKDWVGVHA